MTTDQRSPPCPDAFCQLITQQTREGGSSNPRGLWREGGYFDAGGFTLISATRPTAPLVGGDRLNFEAHPGQGRAPFPWRAMRAAGCDVLRN